MKGNEEWVDHSDRSANPNDEKIASSGTGAKDLDFSMYL